MNFVLLFILILSRRCLPESLRLHPLIRHFNNNIVATKDEKTKNTSDTTLLNNNSDIAQATDATESKTVAGISEVSEKNQADSMNSVPLASDHSNPVAVVEEESPIVAPSLESVLTLENGDDVDSFFARIEEIPEDEIGEIDNFWIDINGGFIAWKAVICLNLLDYKKLAEVYHTLVDTLGILN